MSPGPAPRGEGGIAGVRAAPLVEARGLSCRFPDGTLALAEVDLAVHGGEIVAVMGASGAGKSTLLECLGLAIPALEPAQVTGELRLFGERAADLTPAALAGRVGVLFQDFEAQLFSTNVALEIGFGLDQIGVPPPQIRERTEAALRLVGLGGFASRDPATLSGGEKQRLAIAAICALSPQVVLLDEPTTDIDPLGKRAVLELLRGLRDAGAAVVVVEHEPAAAEVADRLILLERGRVRAAGPSRELARRVDLLEACGVRPRDLDVIGSGLGIERRLAGVDDAAQELGRRGLLRPAGVPPPSPPAAAPPAAATATATRPLAPALLEAIDLGHVYAGGTVALDGVSLSIGAGEFVALIGQNGSGKTTLAQHLNGLLAPTSGAVRVAGTDARELGLGRVARVVGFVFQDPDHQIFGDTVQEEIAFGLRHLGLDAAAVAARVERWLEISGLAGRRDADPFLLAKGDRQRLAVASVLALEPRVLVLDEPTTGLDDRQQRALLDLLRDLHRRGTTVIAITHAPWVVAEYAERAVLLSRGRVAFDGPVADLFADPEVLRRAAFELPEATELGLRAGVGVRSPRELLRALDAGSDAR